MSRKLVILKMIFIIRRPGLFKAMTGKADEQRKVNMEKKWWKKRLLAAGCRLTAPRTIIMNIMLKTPDHVSAEEIYIKSLKVKPSIGLTTVYRTLDLFLDIGILRKFEFGDGKARYELINNPEKNKHHHHIICLRCKNVIDYSDYPDEETAFLAKTEKLLSDRHNFMITHHLMDFYGICKECRAE